MEKKENKIRKFAERYAPAIAGFAVAGAGIGIGVLLERRAWDICYLSTEQFQKLIDHPQGSFTNKAARISIRNIDGLKS